MSRYVLVQADLMRSLEVSVTHVRPTGMRGRARRGMIEGVREQ